jgi:hypothetical protein
MVFLESVLNGNFSVIISATQLQVNEFHRQFSKLWYCWKAECGVQGEVQMTQAEFSNGGRVLTRTSSENTPRGLHEAAILIYSEAAKIPDEVYSTVEPVRFIGKGRKVAESTPCGKRGWFWEEWNAANKGGWKRKHIPWTQCPRLPPEEVEQYARSRGELMARQEFGAQFLDIIAGNPFDLERWENMRE